MTEVTPTSANDPNERRRTERRSNSRIGDLTLPEVRRILITTLLGAVVLALFLWMVRSVIVAAILGMIIGFYLRPPFKWVRRGVHNRNAAAIVTLVAVILPILLVLVYSYSELADVVSYASQHRQEISVKVDASMTRLPFLQGARAADAISNFVENATAYGTRIPALLRSALAGFTIAATVFLFTAFYVLIDAKDIGDYLAGKIPPRYAELRTALEVNVRGVLYGAIYSTLLTQTLKSLIILGMNLAFQVPLAGVLAVVSFIVGFFPIVGSWSVYVPVAIWLVIFRDAVGPAIAMVVIGTLVNTVFISTYLRPKIAADRSKVLNFYWMFIALITGVYTFGLAGILLGPILIGLLKAVVDTVTARTSWQQLLELGDDEEQTASPSA
jgi:predicted PurR-regulated permease PerM